MAQEHEYIVSLNKGVDYDQFWDQIENASDDDGFVPARRVDIANNRPGSLRSCHYALTDPEAHKLRSDPRVHSVEVRPNFRSDIEIGFNSRQSGNFTKNYSDFGNGVNWGLRRCIETTNIWGDEVGSVAGDYTYNVDGSEVDIVIQDSGLQVDHPEFTDSNGVSRVQQINWYTASGLPGTQSSNHYRDYHGHGTHVAGIAAGKTFGWAKNANIYSVKVAGLEGSGDSGTGISITDCFDVIKLWHRNKPINPRTGYKRPTVVNMSWGYGGYRLGNSYSNNGLYGTYRGTSWVGEDYPGVPADLWYEFGVMIPFFGYRFIPARVGSVDSDLEELIDEGVHVCIAAGNNYHLVDVPGGADYNNTCDFGLGYPEYYHRGSSPYSQRAFLVGNIDRDTHFQYSGVECCALSSCAGPGVHIYAPGTSIMSACSQTSEIYGAPYHLNENYKQANIDGTSMASPQVAGYAASLLQIHPSATPEKLQQLVIDQSVKDVLYPTVDPTKRYRDTRSLLYGNNRFLYHAFNNPQQYSIT